MISLPPRFLSPKDLATAIGVGESSVKRWIDDGRLTAVRTAGGHRRIPLTEAVRYIREQRLSVADGTALGLGAISDVPGSPEDDRQRIMDALRAGDAQRLRAHLTGLYLGGGSLAALCDGPITAAMREIGTLWTHGTDGIAIEHLATDACIQAIQALRGLVPQPVADAPLALGGGPPGDPYLLPTTMVALTLAEAGFRSVNLGPETPIDVLRVAIGRHRPRLIWMSFTTETADVDGCMAGLAELSAATGLPAVIGGQVFRKRPSPPSGLHLVDGMRELASFARGAVTATTRP
jgi:MerR family transcriptional regulator, light-induced transcriptional regulator